MPFRVRLLLIIISLMLLTAGVATYLLDRSAQARMLLQYHAKTLSVATTAAALIDGDALEKIRQSDDEATDLYRALAKQLRNVRDSNRRADIWVKFVTTVYADGPNGAIVRFGVDPEEDPEEHSAVGEVYRVIDGQKLNLETAGVESKAVEDQWGNWLTAHAPVRNRSGKIVGAVMVDIPYKRVESQERGLLRAAGVSFALALVLGGLAAMFLGRSVAAPLATIAEACRRIGKGEFDFKVSLARNDEFGEVGRALEQMANGLKERETVKTAFARYVSGEVLESVIKSEGSPQLHGHRRRITVLFCDIRGFTSLSEKMRPEDVVTFLNTYFERMVDIIFEHKGTLDKFIGDGMMVLFGAPAEDPYQEEHAVKAAVAMQKELARLRGEYRVRGFPEIRIGIGIHSGNAIVGNIGSSKRLEYTAIGDTVNLASRLESATKELGAEIVISESTTEGLSGALEVRKLGAVKVRGRSNEVVTYTV